MTARNPQKTRDALLLTAAQEIHTKGYQGMRVDEVLKIAGFKKGAFYHHFSSKKDLGYAVLEEQIVPMLQTIWIEPLAAMQDPISDIPAMLQGLDQRIPPLMREHGCPLNNLAQEMSQQDAGFQQRIAEIFGHWAKALASVFDNAKTLGHVRSDIDSLAVARFVVASIEGCIGIYKVEHSRDQWSACVSQITAYLGTLKPIATH